MPELSFQTNIWKNEWTDRIRAQWESQKAGCGSSIILETFVFVKTNERHSTTNMELVISPMNLAVQPDESFYFIHVITTALIQERFLSNDRLTLRPKNPADDQIIKNNYLTDRLRSSSLSTALTLCSKSSRSRRSRNTRILSKR